MFRNHMHIITAEIFFTFVEIAKPYAYCVLCACAYVSVWECVCICVCMCMSMNMCVCMYLCLCVCEYVYVHVSMNMCMCMCVCIHECDIWMYESACLCAQTKKPLFIEACFSPDLICLNESRKNEYALILASEQTISS